MFGAVGVSHRSSIARSETSGATCRKVPVIDDRPTERGFSQSHRMLVAERRPRSTIGSSNRAENHGDAPTAAGEVSR